MKFIQRQGGYQDLCSNWQRGCLKIKVGVLSDEELRNLSWKIGILKRGYYVVGAHMAQTIDTKLGRKALIQTISEGASEFFKLYNSQVTDNQKVFFSPK